LSKKKRKKLFRSAAKSPSLPAEMQRVMDEEWKTFDKAFQASCCRVREILAQFHPSDALIAVNIFDLWQPNCASQVKHQFAFSLLVSTPANCFTSARMTKYEEFSGFCSELIEALPGFPMLEDYVPELDWGEVKVLLECEPVAILSGGFVQRLADHIEAFRICHGDGTQASVDLESAIRLQGELLRLAPRNGGGPADAITPGHVEVPPAPFWEVISLALKQLSEAGKIRDRYVVELGQARSWQGANSFSEAIMTGKALPWLAARIDGTLVPISLRNAVTVVIDSWAKATQNTPVQVATGLSWYLAKRIQSHSCLIGPLLLRSSSELAPLPIAAALFDGSHNFVVVPVLDSQLALAGKAVTCMRRIMSNRDWGFQLAGTFEGFQLRDAQGEVPGPNEVHILLVKASVSTEISMVRQPIGDARLISLVDACTIFDSIVSVEELARFWTYVEGLGEFGGGGFSDLGDQFGSFRDAHAQIIEGALTPTFLSLDPHWGASWRYGQLKEFWKNAPLIFPDENGVWETHKSKGMSSLARVTAKNAPKLAWSAVIGAATLYFILDAEEVGLLPQDGSLLELFVHCAADSIAERASIIEPFLQSPLRRINLHCFSADHLLASAGEVQVQRAAAMPLIAGWADMPKPDAYSYEARVTVNLAKLVLDMEDAEDARFEAACASTVVEHLFSVLGVSMLPDLRQALADTATRRPRFTLNHMQRTVDVPDFTPSQTPRAEDYKVARRDLAILLKAQGVAPGTYELDVAKALINPARASYRDAVHQRIRALDRESLLRYCVKQYDALIASYDREELRITQSLRHEVDFDREETLAEAHEKFVRESRNYRYLLESALVLTSPQDSPVRAETVLSIQAMVDWLFVLYGASDVLHHGIDVCSGQLIPDTTLSFSSARAGANPSLN